MGSDVARLLEAVDFAARKHKEQRRLDPEGTPYINHPIGAETPLPGNPCGPSLPHPWDPSCPGALPTAESPSLWSLGRTVSLLPYHVLQPDGAELPKRCSPGPCPALCLCVAATTLLHCCEWGPQELLRGPCATIAPAEPGDSSHLGDSASTAACLPAQPKDSPCWLCPWGFPCPGSISGKPPCPLCSPAPCRPRESLSWPGAAGSPVPPSTFPFSLQASPGSWHTRPA